MTSVFAEYHEQGYPFQFAGRIHVYDIHGGIPNNPKVIESWLRTKFADNDVLIRQAVSEVMAERAVPLEEAIRLTAEKTSVNGFARDDDGLYIKGMQLKACLKEAANIRWPDRRWVTGKSMKGGDKSKGTLSWFPEHLFVIEDRLHLGVYEPDGTDTRFVHTWKADAIATDEFVTDAEFDFHVETDYQFTDEDWGLLWVTAEQMALGAARRMGHGKFEVVAWKAL